MTALVTGAAGFVGRTLVGALLERGEEVVAFDVDAEGVERLAAAGATGVVGDLARWNDVLDAVTSHDVLRIFHCGALLSAGAEAAPTAAYAANVDGTHHVLETARALGLERVVVTSTMATFGRGAGDPVADDAPQWPTTLYGCTKVFAERLVEYYTQRYGVDVRALRFPSIVGRGRGGSGASAFTSLVFDEPAAGRPWRVYVSLDVRCQLLHVDDAARALVEFDAAPQEVLHRCVYNIGGIAPTARELVDAAVRAFPRAELSFEPDPQLEAIVRSWPLRLDDAAARGDWGWRTELDLDGIARRFGRPA